MSEATPRIDGHGLSAFAHPTLLPMLPFLILWPRVFLERVQQNAFLDCQSQQFSCIMRAYDKHNHFQVLSLFPKEL
jgi:hypothetical protein